MDYNWKFLSLVNTSPPSCPSDTFPINMNNVQCYGLGQVTANSADQCRDQCCADPGCATWQWCSTSDCGTINTCWIGNMNDCSNGHNGWISQGRNIGPINTTCDSSFCQPGYDDSNWRTLNIPHDFIVEGTFNQSAEQSHGFLPKGLGWYRKHFTVDKKYQGQSIWLYFEGIYRDSTMWLNGQFLGNHPSGYTSFYYDITSVLNYGTENVLAVEVDPRTDEGWWYEGGGIYRHVWLFAADPLHITPWGIYVLPTVTGTITHGSAGPVASSSSVSITTEVVNGNTTSQTFNVVSQIYDGTTLVGSATTSVTINAGSNSTTSQTINLSNTKLWDVSSPHLYSLVTTLSNSLGTIDSTSTSFGIRKSVFDKDQGYFLNDAPVKVKGLCNHQDFAGVGIALPKRINQFRVNKLQEMGANAWRMSHNPPNPELLDLTDEFGMLVWDENRNFYDSPQYREDVATLPLRDRNHPSIIIWSLCNEGGCQEGANDPVGLATAQTFKGIIQQYDKTRPVSAAWNSDINDLINGWGPKVLDLQGVNYNYGEYDQYHSTYPNKPMIASETASCTGARGIYVTNDTAAHKSIFSADGCANQWWTADETRNFIAGGFAWTGFDYKGEPTPYGWPEINSNFGILDISGFPKDTFWYYQSWWTPNPVLHVFPHWNPPVNTNSLSVASCNTNDQYQSIKFTGTSSTPGNLVTSDGRCIDATCNDVSVGCVPLAIKTCNANDQNQLFVHKADGSFSNAANGGCIDLWDSGTGPDVGVYSCDGGSNQHWTITGNDIQSDSTGNRCMSYGPSTNIWAYTNAASAELFVNGVSQGKQAVPALGHVQWSPAYEAGTIMVQAYDSNNKVIATQSIETTGSPYAISLSVEVGADGIEADAQDAAMIKVSIVDSKGRVVPTASNKVSFSVSGQGSILGVGNGDPSSHEPDKANYRSAFNGLARVLVQSTMTPGKITLMATSPGLTSATVSVNTVAPQNPYPIL